jgi:DNA polymerase delta subunit 2
MLEDESGRIRLVGERVSKALLVTGVIVAVLGVETPNGEFEVVDLCMAGLAPQTRSKDQEEGQEKMELDGEYLKHTFAILFNLMRRDRCEWCFAIYVVQLIR